MAKTGRRWRGWLLLLAVAGVAAVVLSLLGLPAPFVFAGMVAGAVCALGPVEAPRLPRGSRQLSMGVIGVGAGSMIDAGVARTVADNLLLVVAAVFGTLAISILVGQSLRLYRDVSGPTAVFASIAGGASGVVAMARDFGADERVVLTVQYLRVLVVLLTIPLLVPLFGEAGSGGVPAAPEVTAADGVFTIVALGVGLLLARLLRFSGSALVVPMFVAVLLSLSGTFGDVSVLSPVMNLAYAAIGARVGLMLTRDVLRILARLMPLALIQVAVTIAACAGIGLLLADRAGLSAMDGYLATTPGGLPAVTAIAISSGSNVAVILAVQLIRVMASHLLTPFIGLIFRRRA